MLKSCSTLRELTHLDREGVLDRYRYQYDLAGNKTGIEKCRRGLEDESGKYRYGYDAIGRLSEVIKEEQLLRAYSYDAFGNRIGMREEGKETAYVYNTVNQLLTSGGKQLLSTADSVLEETATYGYDKRGNMTKVYKSGTLTNEYFFGALNRLECAVNYQTGQGATYQYNGLGHRIGRVEGTPSESVLLMARLDQLSINPTKQIDDVIDLTKQYYNLLERNENSQSTQFTWDNNVLSATETDGSQYRYMQDELGSPIRVLDVEGVQKEVYGYDEFGQDVYGNQGIAQPFGYTGYQMNAITNTYFAQAREYKREVGRFIAEDVIKGNVIHPFTLNLYGYCWSQPVNLIDRDGRKPEESGFFIPDTVIEPRDPEITYYDKDPDAKSGTFSIGGTIDATCFAGVALSAVVSVDRYGNYAFQTALALPYSERYGTRYVGGIDVGMALIVQWSDAQTIFDLEGLGESAGGSGGLGGYFGLDGINLDTDNDLEGGAFYIGPGFGVDSHIVKSYTSTMFSINFREKWKGLKESLGFNGGDCEAE